jgi:hypothetical protein
MFFGSTFDRANKYIEIFSLSEGLLINFSEFIRKLGIITWQALAVRTPDKALSDFSVGGELGRRAPAWPRRTAESTTRERVVHGRDSGLVVDDLVAVVRIIRHKRREQQLVVIFQKK